MAKDLVKSTPERFTQPKEICDFIKELVEEAEEAEEEEESEEED